VPTDEPQRRDDEVEQVFAALRRDPRFVEVKAREHPSATRVTFTPGIGFGGDAPAGADTATD
jgi:hypothetical protein